MYESILKKVGMHIIKKAYIYESISIKKKVCTSLFLILFVLFSYFFTTEKDVRKASIKHEHLGLLASGNRIYSQMSIADTNL